MLETVDGSAAYGVDDVEETACWGLVYEFVDDTCSRFDIYLKNEFKIKRKGKEWKEWGFFTLLTSFRISTLNPLFEEILVSTIRRRSNREMIYPKKKKKIGFGKMVWL